MESLQTLYTPETIKERLSLSDAQKETVRAITLGIEEVDEAIRSMAVDDVIATLENGHPLNRIIEDKDGNTIGYIACEDFIPHEAYIKYFGASGQTGRNLLREIPAFLEYAKSHGYTRLNFHGWNDRLNHILERYGFQRARTDAMLGYNVDLYEKTLGPQKTTEEIQQERITAFEKKIINKVNQTYQETLGTFSVDMRQEKERMIGDAFSNLDRRLAGVQDKEKWSYGERQQAVLKLKLARYFQKNDLCDINTLFDALLETPRFMDTDKGSLHRLFEVHEQKTVEKVAEMRKARAEIGDGAASNPYEALFTTSSGNYYMARLLNMPHLQQESEYMNNCVGTSDSYVNRMKRGDIEILSFRHVPTINPKTGKLEGDTPVMTIEYNLKANTIEQIKKVGDKYLETSDPFFNDIIEALKNLRATTTDIGKPRNFRAIASSALKNITVKDQCLFTERGEVHFRDFDPDSGDFILKMGKLEITPQTPKADAAKIVRIVENIQCNPDAITYNEKELTKETKVYIGPLSEAVLYNYPNLEHIYTSFPESRVRKLEPYEVSPENLKTGQGFIDAIKAKAMDVYDWAKHMLAEGKTKDGETFDNLIQKRREELEKSGKPETINLARLTVNDLFGDNKSHTVKDVFAKAKEFGLELCPVETGPLLRLAYTDQPMSEYLLIAHEPITFSGGRPFVFSLHRGDDGGVWLGRDWAEPDLECGPDRVVVFRLRK